MKKIYLILSLLMLVTTASCSSCYTSYWGRCYSVEIVEPCRAPVSTYVPYLKSSTPYYYAVPPGYVDSSMSSSTPPPPIPEDTMTIYTPLPF